MKGRGRTPGIFEQASFEDALARLEHCNLLEILYSRVRPNSRAFTKVQHYVYPQLTVYSGVLPSSKMQVTGVHTAYSRCVANDNWSRNLLCFRILSIG